jgi:hypothetical protein
LARWGEFHRAHEWKARDPESENTSHLAGFPPGTKEFVENSVCPLRGLTALHIPSGNPRAPDHSTSLTSICYFLFSFVFFFFQLVIHSWCLATFFHFANPITLPIKANVGQLYLKIAGVVLGSTGADYSLPATSVD